MCKVPIFLFVLNLQYAKRRKQNVYSLPVLELAPPEDASTSALPTVLRLQW